VQSAFSISFVAVKTFQQVVFLVNPDGESKRDRLRC